MPSFLAYLKYPNSLLNKNPTIAPYADLGQVKLRLTSKAKTHDEGLKLINPFEQELKKKVQEKVYISSSSSDGYSSDSKDYNPDTYIEVSIDRDIDHRYVTLKIFDRVLN